MCVCVCGRTCGVCALSAAGKGGGVLQRVRGGGGIEGMSVGRTREERGEEGGGGVSVCVLKPTRCSTRIFVLEVGSPTHTH